LASEVVHLLGHHDDGNASSTRREYCSMNGEKRCGLITKNCADPENWGFTRRIDSDVVPEQWWYTTRFGHGSRRVRRIGIVALARKLLIALWRYLETGVIPDGAVLKA